LKQTKEESVENVSVRTFFFLKSLLKRFPVTNWFDWYTQVMLRNTCARRHKIYITRWFWVRWCRYSKTE